MWTEGDHTHPERTFSQQPQRRIDKTHKGEIVAVERKTISILLRENHQGIYLRIAEEAGGRHNSIIIPASGFAEFKRKLNEVIDVADVNFSDGKNGSGS